MIFVAVTLWYCGLLLLNFLTPLKENKNIDPGKKNIWLGGKILNALTTEQWYETRNSDLIDIVFNGEYI